MAEASAPSLAAPPSNLEPLAGAPALLETLLDPTAALPVTYTQGPLGPSELCRDDASALRGTKGESSGARLPTEAPGPLSRFIDAVILVAQSYIDARTARCAGAVLAGSDELSWLDEDAQERLGRAKVVESSPEGLRTSAAFRSARAAWSAVLVGDSQDLQSCGDTTLDQWAAGLIADLAGRPGEFENIRRQLRKQKIAAFGMLD